MNYNPCLSYKEGGKELVIPYKMKTNSKLNVFMVYEPEGSKEPSTLWAIVPDSNENIHFTTQTLRKRSGRIIEYADTTLHTAIISLYNDQWKGIEIEDNSHIKLLGDDTTQYYGQFSEFLFFDNEIGTLDLCKIYSYLVMKYSITVQGLDLISSKNDTIWQYSQNSEYPHEMSVLCRDNGYNLHQKQCGGNCATSELTAYVGKLCENNWNNEVVLEDDNYFVITNNGDSLKSIGDTIYSYDESESYVRFRKEWNVSVIGQDFRIMPVNIKLYYENASDSLSPKLFLIRSDSLSYRYGEMEIYAPDSVDSEGYCYYNNIIWDNDGNGYDRFCFGTIAIDKQQEISKNGDNTEFTDYDIGTNEMPSNNRKHSSNCMESESSNASILSLNLFPNPSYGDFIIIVDLDEVQKINVRIISVDGKCISNNNIDGLNHYEIRKHIEMTGSYIIEVSTATDKLAKTIVIY